MEVTVAVATYGEDSWIELARERAIPSAESQAPTIHVHGESLHDARNEALERVETEFVIYLDADDELEPGYVVAMGEGTADLRAPRIRQIRPNRRPRSPFMPQVFGHQHDCTAECLRYGNWIVIGACARAELLRQVGGWEAWGWSEDWALWARCWAAGGTVEALPKAIYRAHVRPDSRNRQAPEDTARWHREIEAAVWPAEPSVL